MGAELLYSSGKLIEPLGEWCYLNLMALYLVNLLEIETFNFHYVDVAIEIMIFCAAV